MWYCADPRTQKQDRQEDSGLYSAILTRDKFKSQIANTANLSARAAQHYMYLLLVNHTGKAVISKTSKVHKTGAPTVPSHVMW